LIGDRTPDTPQRFLYQAKGSADAARQRLPQFAIWVVVADEVIGILDEIGFIKRGNCFQDRNLYLPKQWCNDPGRREQAKVPADETFQTKPEQAMAMLAHGWQVGVPMRWVAGEINDDTTALQEVIAHHERWYVLMGWMPTPA
jgi:SRSO17 transposase